MYTHATSLLSRELEKLRGTTSPREMMARESKSIYTRRVLKGHKTIVKLKNRFNFEAQKEKIKIQTSKLKLQPDL